MGPSQNFESIQDSNLSNSSSVISIIDNQDQRNMNVALLTDIESHNTNGNNISRNAPASNLIRAQQADFSNDKIPTKNYKPNS